MAGGPAFPYIRGMDRLRELSASPRALLVFVLAASLAALAVAYTAQYVFGLAPCVLCLYQRIPFAVAAGIATIGLVALSSDKALVSAVVAAGIVFAIGSAIAVYHVGVEKHWWVSVAACGGSLPSAMTVEELRARLMMPPPVPCDRIAWSLFGLSMAAYNAIASALLAIGTLAGARVAWAERDR